VTWSWKPGPRRRASACAEVIETTLPGGAVRAAAEAGLMESDPPRVRWAVSMLLPLHLHRELAQACASTSVIVDVHTSVGSEPILRFGPRTRSGIGCLARVGELLGALR